MRVDVNILRQREQRQLLLAEETAIRQAAAIHFCTKTLVEAKFSPVEHGQEN
jgi:hypothetical protein